MILSRKLVVLGYLDLKMVLNPKVSKRQIEREKNPSTTVFLRLENIIVLKKLNETASFSKKNILVNPFF